MLLRHGANPVQVNTKGKSPLDVATNDDIIKLLRSEMIASSSSGSSVDEVRSPTSPESGSSDKEESMTRVSGHSKHGNGECVCVLQLQIQSSLNQILLKIFCVL